MRKQRRAARNDVTDLKYFAVVWHREAELLLVERVQSSTCRHRLLFLNASLAVHQVDLDVWRWITQPQTTSNLLSIGFTSPLWPGLHESALLHRLTMHQYS